MKLSMWNIANRLSSFDLELEIDEKAPAILNSARLAYATNCVHVYPEKDYIVCNGEGNIIKIRNMKLTQAFEIIQGTFDYFEDWYQQLRKYINDGNYQEAVNLCWPVFHNPLVLFDGNNKVLGITRQYGPSDLDDEWAYLYQYGYSSLNAINMMKHQYSNIAFHRHGSQAYKFNINQMMKYAGIYYHLYFNDVSYGHLNLLARDRALNEGDYQLLERLARLLEPCLGRHHYEITQDNGNVFYNILFGKPCDHQKLEKQLHYQQWDADSIYHLALIRLHQDSDQQGMRANLDVMAQTVMQRFPQCIVLKKNPYILLLSNFDLSTDHSAMTFFKDMLANNPIVISFSLPCKRLERANRLYKQAESACFYGTLFHKDERFYHFFDYALDFIIDSSSLSDCVEACMPGIVELWEMQQACGDEMLTTLKCFLDHERSASKTASKLFTHRNTILYRIQKIQDILKCDLDDVYVRDYCRISMRTLELYQQKKLPPD
ncbi:MAG: hypothetical protein HFI89_07605 [Lachnospiraceae bacterium]|nr:hypothetical protein [Lachnospiraceae bacterium]